MNVSKLTVKRTPGGLFYAVYYDGREVPETRDIRKWRVMEELNRLKTVLNAGGTA